jgi:hypothetical protein
MSKAADLANLIGNINAGGGGVNRNLVINGDMSVSQRATSVSSITGAGYKVLDRHRLGGSVPGTWTWSQSTTVPSGQGFGNSLKLDCTATGSAGSMYIQHKMEGQNLQGFAKGTSDAKPFALSFWVRSNKTGTYIAQLLDNDNTRHVSKSYTISSANTWEHKKITFPADTTGAFDNDNDKSLEIYLWLSADSNNSDGTLATTWASVTAANNAVGQVNLADSIDNEWYLTGLQLEIGQNPTSFEHESFETTRQKCLRYFEKKLHRSGQYIAVGFAYTTTSGRYSLDYESIKRANPDVTFSGNISIYKNGNDNAAISPSSDQPGDITSRINIDLSSESMTAGTAFGVHADSEFSYLIDAEL